MFDSLKAKLLALGAAGAILVGTMGGIAAVHAQADANPTPDTSAAAQQAPDDTEATEVAGVETEEANEPALPGGGHQDQPEVDVQHEFVGIE